MSAAEPAATPTAVGVAELHDLLRGAVRRAGLEHLWVTGVVSGLRRGPKFTSWELVEYQPDATTVRAVLPVGAFAREVGEITQVLAAAGVELADGLELSVYGRLEPAPAYGRLRLLAQAVDARVAVGASVLRRQELLAELERSGELAAQRSLALPAVIRRLGLISSPTASGRADVLSVLAGAPAPIEVVEAPAAMSGPAAPAAVARALDRLEARGVQAIVIARGGGARSDLAAWDTPEVAQAIARCRVPVLTALGHATDQTVADIVAHSAHETPSAAAAVVVARAEAVARREEAAVVDRSHQVQLAQARHRARWAVLVALVAVVLLLLVLSSMGGGR
jgi:exodeoxyribonuclease VII large subunit